MGAVLERIAAALGVEMEAPHRPGQSRAGRRALGLRRGGQVAGLDSPAKRRFASTQDARMD